MSSSRFDARLAKLEREGVGAETIYGWREAGEKSEQAVARRCPAGVPPGVTVVLYSWSDGSA